MRIPLSRGLKTPQKVLPVMPLGRSTAAPLDEADVLFRPVCADCLLKPKREPQMTYRC
jgi:hypothetical protein